LQELSDKKIKIVHGNGKTPSGSLVPKKKLTLFGLFAPPEIDKASGKNAATILKEPVLKNPHLDVPRADLITVRNWVALEEKIVHDYKEQKIAPFKNTLPLPKTSAKQPPPAFETFSIQSMLPSSPHPSKFKVRGRTPEKKVHGPGRFLWALGWLLAGGLVFWYVHGALLNREVSQQFVQIQSEKEQLERSYIGLEKASAGQNAKIKQLNSQLQDMTQALRAAQNDRAAYERGVEKKYREELIRITIQYEAQMNILHDMIRVKDAIANALKAQTQALENIIDQAQMAAVSGMVSRLFQQPALNAGTFASQGHVLGVNLRQGFIETDLGAEQGARSGRGIAISRGSIVFAEGRVDRAYPTASAVIIYNKGMLRVIQKGDSVSFS
jgi:hypothetical protein